jgi:hypothetical protein
MQVFILMHIRLQMFCLRDQCNFFEVIHAHRLLHRIYALVS